MSCEKSLSNLTVLSSRVVLVPQDQMDFLLKRWRARWHPCPSVTWMMLKQSGGFAMVNTRFEIGFRLLFMFTHLWHLSCPLILCGFRFPFLIPSKFFIFICCSYSVISFGPMRWTTYTLLSQLLYTCSIVSFSQSYAVCTRGQYLSFVTHTIHIFIIDCV